MEPSQVRATVIKVVNNIHKRLNPTDSDAPEVTGATCPGRDLNKFDSKIWPVAISRIAKALKVKIPEEEKLFGKDNNNLQTIDQIVEKVCKIMQKAKKDEKAKAANQ